MQRYEAIVVGLGAMGSAAFYHLSKQLDPQGSSHGLSRIIRLAYQEHPDYVPLLKRSYSLWRELEQATGKPYCQGWVPRVLLQDIMTITGALDCSLPATTTGAPAGHSCFEGALAAAQQHSLRHEVLSAQQVNQRFPGFQLSPEFKAVHQPDGGFLVPERGIEAHVAAGQRYGGRVLCGTKVLSWEAGPASPRGLHPSADGDSMRSRGPQHDSGRGALRAGVESCGEVARDAGGVAQEVRGGLGEGIGDGSSYRGGCQEGGCRGGEGAAAGGKTKGDVAGAGEDNRAACPALNAEVGGGGGGGGKGAVVHTQSPSGERVSYWGRRVVLAAGPWLGELVPEMKPLLSVERQVVGWFQVLRPAYFQQGRFPVFLLQDETGYYYGFPADKHGFKIGKYHHRHEVVDPNTISREVTTQDEQVLRQCVERYFQGAAGPLLRSSVCMFTNTPDEHFILDTHPLHPQVVLCSACSGHGYKFASVVGSMLAELALTGRSTQQGAGFLRLDPGRPGHAQLLGRWGAGGEVPGGNGGGDS